MTEFPVRGYGTSTAKYIAAVVNGALDPPVTPEDARDPDFYVSVNEKRSVCTFTVRKVIGPGEFFRNDVLWDLITGPHHTRMRVHFDDAGVHVGRSFVMKEPGKADYVQIRKALRELKKGKAKFRRAVFALSKRQVKADVEEVRKDAQGRIWFSGSGWGCLIYFVVIGGLFYLVMFLITFFFLM